MVPNLSECMVQTVSLEVGYLNRGRQYPLEPDGSDCRGFVRVQIVFSVPIAVKTTRCAADVKQCPLTAFTLSTTHAPPV